MASKYQQLAGILRSELASLGRQGGRLPTESELAGRYHMSRQTVRHALKVLAEEGLIESRQGSGSFLTSAAFPTRSREIGLLVTYGDDYIYPKVIHDLQEDFSRAGFAFTVYETGNSLRKEREILEKLLSSPPSGLLAEGTKTAIPSPNDDLYLRLRARGTPIVFFHGAPENLSGFPQVLDDNRAGGYLLTQALLEKGRRRIGGIFKSDDIQGPLRCQGMLKALIGEGLPDERLYWFDTACRNAIVYEEDRSFFDRVFQSGNLDAVLCCNDEIAHYLIRYLLDIGKKVPEDIAVAGFDDSYYSRIGPVPITTLRHTGSQPWQTAAQTLLTLLSGGSAENTLLPWTLVTRDST